ncbi:hypothetical protein [Paenibacillus sp. OV219]|uniref:hypothetical protein n=1 Tax=Paenibacillus sp. OV219 TaxID=1884377 RepID=UPI0008C0BE46|nr:hypothetical protein [Paenibacillus sp. OV219]SEO03432.1 hypothetical protein SAMN05518847_105307 [Paenibacillus sp. OV219]
MRRVWQRGAVRKLIILFIAVIVGISGLVVNGKAVSACDFGRDFNNQTRPDSNVFVGKVLEVRADGHSGYDVSLEVYKVEQGTVKALAKVFTPHIGTCGGFDFKVGEMYYIITIDSKIFPSTSEVFINRARPLLPGEIIEKETIEGQSLLEDFYKRLDVSVSVNAVDLLVNKVWNRVCSIK